MALVEVSRVVVDGGPCDCCGGTPCRQEYVCGTRLAGPLCLTLAGFALPVPAFDPAVCQYQPTGANQSAYPAHDAADWLNDQWAVPAVVEADDSFEAVFDTALGTWTGPTPPAYVSAVRLAITLTPECTTSPPAVQTVVGEELIRGCADNQYVTDPFGLSACADVYAPGQPRRWRLLIKYQVSYFSERCRPAGVAASQADEYEFESWVCLEGWGCGPPRSVAFGPAWSVKYAFQQLHNRMYCYTADGTYQRSYDHSRTGNSPDVLYTAHTAGSATVADGPCSGEPLVPIVMAARLALPQRGYCSKLGRLVGQRVGLPCGRTYECEAGHGEVCPKLHCQTCPDYEADD